MPASKADLNSERFEILKANGALQPAYLAGHIIPSALFHGMRLLDVCNRMTRPLSASLEKEDLDPLLGTKVRWNSFVLNPDLYQDTDLRLYSSCGWSTYPGAEFSSGLDLAISKRDDALAHLNDIRVSFDHFQIFSHSVKSFSDAKAPEVSAGIIAACSYLVWEEVVHDLQKLNKLHDGFADRINLTNPLSETYKNILRLVDKTNVCMVRFFSRMIADRIMNSSNWKSRSVYANSVTASLFEKMGYANSKQLYENDPFAWLVWRLKDADPREAEFSQPHYLSELQSLLQEDETRARVDEYTMRLLSDLHAHRTIREYLWYLLPSPRQLWGDAAWRQDQDTLVRPRMRYLLELYGHAAETKHMAKDAQKILKSLKKPRLDHEKVNDLKKLWDSAILSKLKKALSESSLPKAELDDLWSHLALTPEENQHPDEYGFAEPCSPLLAIEGPPAELAKVISCLKIKQPPSAGPSCASADSTALDRQNP